MHQVVTQLLAPQATITQAEEQLKTISQQPGFAVSVLKVGAQCADAQQALISHTHTQRWLQVVAAGASVPEDVRLAAAVNFKNTVKYRWVGC
jgi:hypothetical protein